MGRILYLSILVILITGCSSERMIEPAEPEDTIITTILRDIDYARYRIFDLGRMDIPRARSDTLPEPDKYDFFEGDSIVKVIVYIDDMTADIAVRMSRPVGICYVDPSDTLSDDPLSEYRTFGYFEQVHMEDYFINIKPNGPGEYGYYLIFLRTPPGSDDIIGVYMEVWHKATNTVDTIGHLYSDTLRLKLIKPSVHTKINHHVWEYQWRNVYWLGRRGMDLSQIDIDIYKSTSDQIPDTNDLDHQGGISYLQILGLDQGDDYGNGSPDGRIDRKVFIDSSLGVLYFPDRHPFDNDIGYYFDGDTPVLLHDSVPEIYINPRENELPQASKYYMVVKIRGD